MKTPMELLPSTGRDDVPAAFPIGLICLVSVTILLAHIFIHST